MCQRKCLIGRATLVLLLSRVKDKKQRVVLKLIWRDESRTDEGESLKLFKGYPGICQCKWSKVCLLSDLSNATGLTSRDLRSQSAKLGILQSQQTRLQLPVDRKPSTIMTDGEIGLSRIKRLPHLLEVLRDGLVEFAGMCLKHKLHRDISEGNILCTSLLNIGIGGAECWSESEAILVDSDFDSMSNNLPPTSEAGEIEYVVISSNTKVDIRPLSAPTYEEYRKQRYNGEVKCIGKLYDLEFMVNQRRDDEKRRSPEKAGTPAFISAQLLLATRHEPVQHTYLHDLESFFWVLVWIVATRVEPGKKMNAQARELMAKLCNPDDQSLGDFKKGFITTPVASGKRIIKLNNGWKWAGGVVYEFAEFLNRSIYNIPVDDSDFLFLETLPETAVPMDEEDPWLDIKRAIDIFDRYICLLQIQP
ncbi:hypothetical protein CTheo_6702 [Ceratobasidium theobromae]|uniref:Fungal-type protein kinase domain-containing protein n=1 Tax=Ceratobasidium theobromae TaxID=1582974 RepID=A0A5N5QEC4_9AGAM|nr:hypothetical protein CTheo_6702 [Ceratobasidium theobromae]